MKCIYCGKETEKNKYTIRVNKGAEEVQCCGRECYLKTRKFIDADNSKKKLLFYIIAAVLVVINLFVLGYKLQVWWMYLPMIGLGAIVVAQPSMYCTPFFYESFGMVKAWKIIRVIGAAIVLIGTLITLFN